MCILGKMHPTFAWYDFVNSSLTTDINFVFSFLFTVAFASVDWHDFVVVETVDFKDSETGKTIINHDIPCDTVCGMVSAMLEALRSVSINTLRQGVYSLLVTALNNT